MTQALVLFSGGIDSTTALYWAVRRFENVHALTFDYGQRHRVEIQLSKETTRNLGVLQSFFQVDLKAIGGSSLTDASLPLPEFETAEEISSGPPSTYVPFRNGIFLSLAAAFSEVKKIRNIVCGFHVIDSPNYPDTRQPFVEAMEEAINLGTRAAFGGERVRIYAPFVGIKKSDIIREGLFLGADYAYSISCYSGKEAPCLKCSSCLLRQKAWEEVGSKDPLLQRLEKEGKS